MGLVRKYFQDHNMKCLIIGGGIAGTSCAEQLRKLDPNTEITIVELEQHHLYSRVLLPHYAMGKVDREKCFLKSEQWYQDQDIELFLGQRVIKLDTKNKFVEIDDARELPYDKLVIASGTEPRTVAGEPRGVVYFWTLDDVDQMLSVLKRNKEIKKEKNKAAVYGGGFIACEFVNVFKEHGLDTTVFFRGKHFWNKTLNEQSGQFVCKHLEKAGVKVLPEHELVETKGDLDLESVVTSQGDVNCSVLGVSIGNQLDFSWMQGTGLETNQGIVTNEFLETNVPDVYSIGDIAESYDPVVDRQYLAGNWGRAMMQGRAVAKTIVGDRNSFEQVCSYAINLLGLDIAFIGDVDKGAADVVVVQEGKQGQGITQIFVRKDKVVGAVILGKSKERNKLTQAIQNKASISSLS
jgi:NAD(P)H-nitrite reductase large subunit